MSMTLTRTRRAFTRSHEHHMRVTRCYQRYECYTSVPRLWLKPIQLCDAGLVHMLLACACTSLDKVETNHAPKSGPKN